MRSQWQEEKTSHGGHGGHGEVDKSLYFNGRVPSTSSASEPMRDFKEVTPKIVLRLRDIGLEGIQGHRTLFRGHSAGRELRTEGLGVHDWSE